jgi:photosystem II stability/assembly factor-like uncharacterized protein
MKNATHNRIRRLLPLVILVGLASSALPVSAGVNVWTTNGPEGRWIQALAIDPSAPATLYAGTAAYSPEGIGVFKSTDAGGSWSFTSALLNDFFFSVPALAVDPSTPSHIYAAAQWTHWDESDNSIVFESADGGANWTAKLSSIPEEAHVLVSALSVDPSAPRTLYAAGNGIFKSTDGGNSWSRSNPSAPGFGVYLRALAIDPSRPATIYAGGLIYAVGTASYEPQSGGVFRSTDAGASWTAVNAGLTSTDVHSLAIDPSSPATLYAGTSNGGGGVFKSTNAGESWTAVNVGLSQVAHSFVNALAIDPSQPSTLYAGTSGGGVFKSTNGGASWAAMNAGLTSTNVLALAIDPSTPSRLYAGTGGGVFDYVTIELPIDRRILPVVGSTRGANGTFFRTSVQLHNSTSTAATGRIVFHPSGVSGSASDPALSYTLSPGQTQPIEDLLPAMGRSGLGSADIEATSGSIPAATVRVFNDAGAAGTTGFTEEPMRADEALRAGQSGILLLPADATRFRFNLGVRTLEGGATATLTVRDASGAVLTTVSRDFPATHHEQQSAAPFLGVPSLPPGGSISIAMTSGAGIFYGATVDNRTGDPSFQIANVTP